MINRIRTAAAKGQSLKRRFFDKYEVTAKQFSYTSKYSIPVWILTGANLAGYYLWNYSDDAKPILNKHFALSQENIDQGRYYTYLSYPFIQESLLNFLMSSVLLFATANLGIKHIGLGKVLFNYLGASTLNGYVQLKYMKNNDLPDILDHKNTEPRPTTVLNASCPSLSTYYLCVLSVIMRSPRTTSRLISMNMVDLTLLTNAGVMTMVYFYITNNNNHENRKLSILSALPLSLALSSTGPRLTNQVAFCTIIRSSP